VKDGPPVPLLIVDDDPVFARFVGQLVQSLGSEMPCVPQWADTAEKALAELRANPYELVLLDYNLPDGNGLQVLGRIRDLPSAQQPAVIMLTASGSETVAVEAMKRGAKDYLAKTGLDVPPLMRALQTALRQKRLADEVANYHAQIEADLEMARSLQRSLLPDRCPVFPRHAAPGQSTLRFCYRFEPATRLAGDFFNVLSLSDSCAGVFICDVMGHGVRSALVTAMLRALVDDLAPGFTDPGLFLAEMNRRLAILFQAAAGSLFATALFDRGRRRRPGALRQCGTSAPASSLPCGGGSGRCGPAKAGPALGFSARRPTSRPSVRCPLVRWFFLH
jgi:CheY-like chemotaxis protein